MAPFWATRRWSPEGGSRSPVGDLGKIVPAPGLGAIGGVEAQLGPPFGQCCCHTSPCCSMYRCIIWSLQHDWPSCRLKIKRYGADDATRSDVFLETLEGNTRIVSWRQAQSAVDSSSVCSCLAHDTCRQHRGPSYGRRARFLFSHAILSRMTSSASVSSVASIPESCSRGTIHLDCGAPHSPRPVLVVPIAGFGFLWRLFSQVGKPLGGSRNHAHALRATPKGRLLGIKFYRISLRAALSPNHRTVNWVATVHARPGVIIEAMSACLGLLGLAIRRG